MNAFKYVQEIVERETGFVCVYEQENIEDNQIMISIDSIENTGIHNQYQVLGNLSIKTGANTGWQVLTQILELNFTSMRASAAASDINGFTMMRVDFSMVLKEAEERERIIKNFKIQGVE